MSSGFPAETARAHIEYLAATYNIEVYEIKRQWDSESDVKHRTIYVPDPNTPIRYMIALHEIGHIVDKVSASVVGGDKNYHGPACEAAAWAWAYDNADESLRDHMTAANWRRVGQAWVTSIGKRARSASPRR